MGLQKTGENWRDWLHEWGDRFLLFARQQSGSHAEAEDILQEAIVHVWSKRELFPRIEAGIIFTHIRRVAIDKARKNSRRKVREEAYAEQHAAPFFEPGEDGFSEQLQLALGQIPLEQREVVVLKIWGEQTYESIGKTLDISANTAASRYRYGLDNLRKCLKGVAV
ncbi:MAG: RNA polymerase sigma factor [Puniceicoccaceae bacterium]